MLRELAAHRAFDLSFARMLNACARNPDLPWEDRRVAVLGLEHHLLLADLEAFESALPGLGITADPADLRNRLMRLAPWHAAFRNGDIAGFQDIAAQECLLTLGRWSFQPEEVVARVLLLIRTTPSAADAVEDAAYWPTEIAAVIGELPAYEGDILGRLLAKPMTWWVAPMTSSTVNALVEYPVGSAALIVRSPGSMVEFEIKRAGLRGPQPLKVIFERAGKPVSASHRMQGVSSLNVLRWEGSNGALLSALFRRVHGVAAPTSTMVRRGPIKSVPLPGGGEASVTAWLSDPARFGPGFAEQDLAIAQALAAFGAEYRRPVPAGGPIRDRVRALLEMAPPGQAVLVGTSALRLDKIAAWLQPDGPSTYFGEALGREPAADETRRFADTILREILGVFRPPPATDDFGAYIAAAFAENRAAADRAYDAAVRDIGRFWGTLKGMFGYTTGECFVPRNVGLKPVWEDGAWTVRVVFMDHEYTNIAGRRLVRLEPHLALPCMHHDWAHILGGQIVRNYWPGSFALLGEIYRIGPAQAAGARAALIQTMRYAYRRTRAAMRDDPFVRAHFQPGFIADILAWDGIVAAYRTCPPDAWPAALRALLKSDPPERVEQYRKIIDRYGWWLTQNPYLFASDGGA